MYNPGLSRVQSKIKKQGHAKLALKKGWLQNGTNL